MVNAFEQVKVISSEEKTFTDKNTGEQRTYYVCTGQSTHNEFFIFNIYDEKVDVESQFGMYLEHDRYLKAKIVYKRLK